MTAEPRPSRRPLALGLLVCSLLTLAYGTLAPPGAGRNRAEAAGSRSEPARPGGQSPAPSARD